MKSAFCTESKVFWSIYFWSNFFNKKKTKNLYFKFWASSNLWQFMLFWYGDSVGMSQFDKLLWANVSRSSCWQQMLIFTHFSIHRTLVCCVTCHLKFVCYLTQIWYSFLFCKCSLKYSQIFFCNLTPQTFLKKIGKAVIWPLKK